MSNQLKKKNSAGGGLYIALAICILSVICIGVYSAVINIISPTPAKNPSAQNDPNKTDKNPTVIIAPTTTTRIPTTTAPYTLPDVSKAPEVTAGKEEEENNVSVQASPTPPTYTMPVGGSVTKAFSHDILVYSSTMNDYRVHQGIDIECDMSTDVLSCAYGTVKTTGYDPFMGYTVVIDHGDGLLSYYQNLDEELADGITAGATVYAGQKIGLVGESAIIEIADEPHLHFELELNGKLIDPMTMLDYTESTSVDQSAEQDK